MHCINLNKIKIVLYDGNQDVSEFDCGHEDINEFLYENAHEQNKFMLNSTYLAYFDKKIIGFFTILTDSIKIKELGNEYHEKFKNKNMVYDAYPAIKIGRLGVHKNFLNQGIGTYLLQWIFFFCIELSKDIGLRFITINAYILVYEFYKKNFYEDVYHEKRLEKEFKKYLKAQKRDNNRAKKMTIPLFFDLYDNNKLFFD